jgi:hypothetical protein
MGIPLWLAQTEDASVDGWLMLAFTKLAYMAQQTSVCPTVLIILVVTIVVVAIIIGCF